MKKLSPKTLGKAFMIASTLCALVIPAMPSASSQTAAPEMRTLTITLLSGDGREREVRGDVVMKFDVNDITGVSFSSRQIRHRMF